MWLPWKSNVDSEKLLLRNCHRGDAAALARFTSRSYLREVLRAVRAELQDDYDPEKVERIAKVCMGHIYSLWRDLPVPGVDLHQRIRNAASAFAVRWRRQDLGE